MTTLSHDFDCPWCEQRCHGVPFGSVGQTICAECWFGILPTRRDDEEHRASYREAFGSCLNCAVGDEAAQEMLSALAPGSAGGGNG